MATIRFRRPAMATWFEAWLVGDDPEHLSAVAEAALDEVERIERLLSRHHPAAEVARVNREAVVHSLKIDIELFAVLVDCLSWFERTQGVFDIGRTRPRPEPGGSPRPLPDRLLLSPGRCAVRFTDETLELDLGGYGKGYALDAAARVFEEFGVRSTLMHGGTSSVLARGTQENGRPWKVGIADPFHQEATSDHQHPAGPPSDRHPLRAEPSCHAADGEETTATGFPNILRRAAEFGEGSVVDRSGRSELDTIELSDRALSTSAVRHPGESVSDLIDPGSGSPLHDASACVVLAPRAIEAEVLSTALLVMGEARSRRFLNEEQRMLPPNLAVGWIVPEGGSGRLRWITGG